jgi:lysophospholipase L1-like esterase
LITRAHARSVRFLDQNNDIEETCMKLSVTTTTGTPRRRALLPIGALLAAALAFTAPQLHAESSTAGHWVGTWGAGAGGPPLAAKRQPLSNQTLRLIVRTSIGGNRVRIRLSNEMGDSPLTIGAAHIALRANGADIDASTDRALTFSGSTSITIPPGAPVLSDPVDLKLPAQSDLAVSVYLPNQTGVATVHATASQANYVSQPGNFTGAASLPTQGTIHNWPFLTEVDVDGGAGAGAVVTFGDSITDGTRSTPDTNTRWPDFLARRLLALGGSGQLGVVNRGISGNRLLSDTGGGSLSGRNGLERFDRDVLATAGVRYVTVLLGINDIGHSKESPVTAVDLIAGYRQLISRAHEKGIAILGATLTPVGGSKYETPENEQLRQAVNQWIRTSGELDGVIEFDMVTRDPQRPERFLPAYDSGDHLHPNSVGYEAMGNAVSLALFRAPALSANTAGK